MNTVRSTGGLTLSESVAMNDAVPVKLFWSVTVYVMEHVPWPPDGVTDVIPAPGVALQLYIPPSSLPKSATGNGAAFCVTVATGLGGGLMEGGLFDSAPQETGAVLLLRGSGVPAVTPKSPALLLVSVQPPLARMTAVLLAGAGVGPLPSKQFAVL